MLFGGQGVVVVPLESLMAAPSVTPSSHKGLESQTMVSYNVQDSKLPKTTTY